MYIHGHSPGKSCNLVTCNDAPGSKNKSQRTMFTPAHGRQMCQPLTTETSSHLLPASEPLSTHSPPSSKDQTTGKRLASEELHMLTLFNCFTSLLIGLPTQLGPVFGQEQWLALFKSLLEGTLCGQWWSLGHGPTVALSNPSALPQTHEASRPVAVPRAAILSLAGVERAGCPCPQHWTYFQLLRLQHGLWTSWFSHSCKLLHIAPSLPGSMPKLSGADIIPLSSGITLPGHELRKARAALSCSCSLSTKYSVSPQTEFNRREQRTKGRTKNGQI